MNRGVMMLLAGLLGALLLGIIGFFLLAGYGGNNCDQPPEMTCECFCCHLFGSRGYESCALLGGALGLLLGALGGGVMLWRRS